MNQRKFRLSILDFVYIFEGDTVKQAIDNSMAVLAEADRLGFTRYWFTEHHNTGSLASTSPSLLIMLAGQHSHNIRIGAGGVMLPNHSALRIAEDFTTLEALYPGRVDLGIGRAPGTDPKTHLELAGSDISLDLKFSDLLSYFGRSFPHSNPKSVISIPGDASLTPNIVMLGSSSGGVQYAIQNGLMFSFAAHINPPPATEVLNFYKDHFRPSYYLEKPYSIFTIAVFVAETLEEAQYLSGPAQLMWIRLRTGQSGRGFPTLEEAANYDYSEQERMIQEMNQSRFIIGTADMVKARFETILDETLADEIMIADLYPTQDARLQALNILKDFIK